MTLSTRLYDGVCSLARAVLFRTPLDLMRLRSASVTLVLAAGLLSAPAAFAQSAAIMDDNPHSGAGVTTFTFSRADCQAGASYDVVLNGQDPNAALQVWVTVEGQCETPEARDAATATCFQVPNLARSNVAEGELIAIPAADLANAGISGLSACEDTGTADLRELTVYFLYDVSPGATVAAFASVQMNLDFVGPTAPTILNVGSEGGTTLSIEFEDNSGNDAVEFYAFCEQAGAVTAPTTGAGGSTTTSSTTTSGTGGTGGNGTMQFGQGHKPYGGVGGAGGGSGGTAGAGGTGGTGGTAGAGGVGGTGGDTGSGGTTTSAGGSTSTPTSTSPSSTSTSSSSGTSDGECDEPTTLVQGSIPTVANCGTTGSSPVEASVTNNFNYWVGVAGVDNVGNVGPISGLECSAPTDVDDFWLDYVNGGGKAGGGCACGFVGMPEEGMAWSALGIVGIALLLRRRKEAA